LANEILTERRGRVLVITLNRPEAKNAVNSPLADALVAAMNELDNDDELTIGVLTGADGGFSSGMDLKAFAKDGAPAGFQTFLQNGARKPLIAAIEGFALAGGLEIALTCDLLVASKGARIGIREVKVGLFAAAGGVFRLPARVGYAKAMEMALTGEPITAEAALDCGMLSELTEAGGALEAAINLAERIAVNAPLAVAASKILVRAAAQGIDEETLWKMQLPLQKKVFASDDAKEGPRAFAEKRAPKWTGS
jgi:enoyl-CoA hydratase